MQMNKSIWILGKFNWAMCNKLLPEKTKEQKHHNAIRCEAEALAVLRNIRTETHKQMMARERQLASERKKGKVPLVVTSLNARSINYKRITEANVQQKKSLCLCG